MKLMIQVVQLKNLTNFVRILEMLLINCETNLILTCSASCVICETNIEITFAITNTKVYVPLVFLSNQDKTILLKQMKSGFKSTINCNKYQSKVTTQRQTQYLDILIDPTFHGVSKVDVEAFANI